MSQREWLISTLASVEVIRAIDTRDSSLMARAQKFINTMALVPTTTDLLDETGTLQHAIRSLDAVHVTSALRLRTNLDAFVAYDRRPLETTEAAAHQAVFPGAT